MSITPEQLQLLNDRLKHMKDNENSAGIDSAINQAQYQQIGNGNALSVEWYKKLYDELILGKWEWLITYETYFANLYTIDGTREEKETFKHLIKTLFWFGYGALYNSNDKMKAYGLTPLKNDTNGQVKSGIVWINNLFFMSSGDTFSKNGSNISSNKMAFGKFTSNGLPYIILIWGFIEKIDELYSAFHSNIKFKAKKVIYEVRNKNSSVIKQELKSIFDPKNSIIIKRRLNFEGLESANNIEPLNAGSNDNSLIDEIKKYQGTMELYKGIYANPNIKAERNITREFTGDEIKVKPVINDLQDQLELILEKYNKLFGKQVKLISNIEVWKNDAQSQEGEGNEDIEEEEEE